MESLHLEQASNTGNGLRMSILRRNVSSLLPDICSNSSFSIIADETFPNMYGTFNETMEPSFMLNGPEPTTDLPDQVQLKTLKTQDEVVSDVGIEAKAAHSSWLSTLMEKGQSIDFSMFIASAKDDHEDISNVTKSDLKAVGCHFLESAGCTEKCGMDSKNGTFDMAKDLKERFSELNLTKPVQNETTGSSNTTFEKSEHHQEKSSGLSRTISNDDTSVEDKNINEKHLNSAIDVCAPLNSTTEQPNQKLNGTVDITQSDGSKQEQSSEACACRMDCEKQSTFTKAAKETNATVDMTDVPIEVVQPGSVNVEPIEGTFTKHNTTTDLTPSQPVPDLTVDMIKNPNTESPVKFSTTCGVTVKDTPLSEQSEPPVNTTAPVRGDLSICSDRTVDLPETDCKDGQQEMFGRRNGISDGEGYHNLDISQSSMFSLDEMLDLKPCPLVASTPIVLGRGFDRLQSAKPTNIQKHLSVINSINTHLTDDTAGVSEHKGSASSKTHQLSVKSDACSQTANCTSNSMTTEAAVVNKPPSKPAVRRKIPQPSFKSNIPKTQLPLRPTTLQLPSAGVKPKIAAQTANLPETPSSALHSTRRMVQLNKGKPSASAKNPSIASTVKSSAVASSSTTCNLTADKKNGNTCLALPKPSGLQPYGRGRFGFKPPGSAVPSEATGYAQTINKPTGLSGIRTRNSLLPSFSQKHASNDALPLAKRKKTDLQNQPSCAEAPTGSEAGEGVQKNLTPLTDITSKIPNAGTTCGNCLLLQEKFHTFHKELGGFLQELGQLPDCKKWVLLQHNLESYLEEVKNLRTDHH